MRIPLLVFFASLIGLQGNTGTITGLVPILPTKTGSISIGKYRGKISGQVAPPSPIIAAVWLEASNISAPTNPQSVVLPQTNYQFSKSLIVVPLGTTVLFPNHDLDYHNVYSLSKSKRFDIGRYKADETPAGLAPKNRTPFCYDLV